MMRELAHRHSASASKCLECLWSMMTRSWCFSKKHSRADSGVRAMLHLKLAFSHAQQKPLLWLSSLAKTKSTCKKRKLTKHTSNWAICILKWALTISYWYNLYQTYITYLNLELQRALQTAMIHRDCKNDVHKWIMSKLIVDQWRKKRGKAIDLKVKRKKLAWKERAVMIIVIFVNLSVDYSCIYN